MVKAADGQLVNSTVELDENKKATAAFFPAVFSKYNCISESAATSLN